MKRGMLFGPNPRGAGANQNKEPAHKSKCPNSNNPYGHSRECPCGWARPKQRDGTPEPEYPPTRWPNA